LDNRHNQVRVNMIGRVSAKRLGDDMSVGGRAPKALHPPTV